MIGIGVGLWAKPILVSIDVGAPVITSAGTIDRAVIGQVSTVSGADHTAGTPTWQWAVNGVDIPGATGTTYTPLPGDDLKALAVRLRVTNGSGPSFRTTPSLTVRYAAPTAIGDLTDVEIDELSGQFSFDASEVFEGDNLSFRLTAGDDAASVDNNGTVTVHDDEIRAPTIVTVEAYNSGGAVSRSFVAEVLAVAPSAVGTIPSQTFVKADADATLDIKPYFDGRNITFTIDVVADVATISNGVITINRRSGRTATPITVTATNLGGTATASFTVQINVAAPTVVGGIPLSYAYTEDAGPKTIAAAPAFAGEITGYGITNVAWASINAATGVVTILTDEPQGPTSLTVTATGPGGSANIALSVRVNVAAPVLTGASLAPVEATVGAGEITRNAAPLFAGTGLQFRIVEGDIATVDANGLITIATDAQADQQDITVEAYNDSGAVGYTFTARINDIRPIITDPVPEQTYVVGGASAVIDLSERVSGENLTWTLVDDGGIATLSSAGLLTISKGATASTTIIVDVENSGGTQRISFPVVVQPAAPQLVSPVPALVYTKGIPATYNLAQHVSGDDLTFTRIGTPSFISVTDAGLMTINTGAVQSGSFTVAVSNGTEPGVELAFTINVRLAAPVASGAIPNQVHEEQTGVHTIDAAQYFSGEGITYSLTAGGSVLTINPTTGLISIPTDTIYSNLSVTVRAANGTLPNATRSFTVTVLEVVAGPPRVPIGVLTLTAGTEPGQVWICGDILPEDVFWGDGAEGGDALGTAGDIRVTAGGYTFTLYKGLPIGEAVVGESLIPGGPLIDTAEDVDGAMCVSLILHPDSWGQTLPVSARYVNAQGVQSDPIAVSLAIKTGEPDVPENALTSPLDGELLLSPTDGQLLLAPA